MRKLLTAMFAVGLVLGAAAAVRADDASDPKAIVDKAIKATGGADNLGKHKAMSWKAKGTFHGLGQPIEFTGQWFVQPADKLKTELDFDVGGMKFQRVQVVNGDKGWVSMMGNIQEMSDSELSNAREEMFTGFVTTLLPLQKPEFTLTPLGESKVGDRAAVGVKVAHKGHKDINLYFDKEKGLLLKVQKHVKDMQDQEVDQETLYSDYQEQDGVQRFRKSTIKRDGKDFIDMQISEFKAAEKLDDSLFGKPGQ